jgi:hypothetical protein
MLSTSSDQPKLETFLALSPAALVERFSIGVEHFDRRVLELTDEQLDHAFLAGSTGPDGKPLGGWPCRVLLGHLADAQLAFAHRYRRVVGEERPILQAWDENAFIDSGLYAQQPVAAFIAAIHTLRKWLGPWLASLPPAAWQRVGLHTERGEQALQTILTYDTWHLEHHAWYLNRKVERLVSSKTG